LDEKRYCPRGQEKESRVITVIFILHAMQANFDCSRATFISLQFNNSIAQIRPTTISIDLMFNLFQAYGNVERSVLLKGWPQVFLLIIPWFNAA